MPILARGVGDYQDKEHPKLSCLFSRLKDGQSPDVLFITCSDSRVVPSLFTQTLPGELFIIRNAGNLVPAYHIDSTEKATIEYAVSGLGIKNIIVCGHSNCGAMNGVKHPELLIKLPGVSAAVNQHGPHISSDKSNHNLDQLIEENVLQQMDSLKSHPCVKEAISKDQLEIHGWVYEFETGNVFEHDANTQKFKPIESPFKMNGMTFSFKVDVWTALAMTLGGSMLILGVVAINPLLIGVGSAVTALSLSTMLQQNGMFKNLKQDTDSSCVAMSGAGIS
jgi:carbonic anhydrase